MGVGDRHLQPSRLLVDLEGVDPAVRHALAVLPVQEDRCLPLVDVLGVANLQLLQAKGLLLDLLLDLWIEVVPGFAQCPLNAVEEALLFTFERGRLFGLDVLLHRGVEVGAEVDLGGELVELLLGVLARGANLLVRVDIAHERVVEADVAVDGRDAVQGGEEIAECSAALGGDQLVQDGGRLGQPPVDPLLYLGRRNRGEVVHGSPGWYWFPRVFISSCGPNSPEKASCPPGVPLSRVFAPDMDLTTLSKGWESGCRFDGVIDVSSMESKASEL